MDRSQWNERYRDAASGPAAAARVLLDNMHLLPSRGTALDLACGLGANARVLAAQGLDTYAWDWAAAAIEQLQGVARAQGLPITAEVRDVVLHPPEPGRFDVIVASRFLERSLAEPLMQALRPGGLLFYQTFTRSRAGSGGPSNDAFRLAENELLVLFAPLIVRVYREEGLTGDTASGFRSEAMLVGQKRA
jgi:tellurite methyltransferase